MDTPDKNQIAAPSLSKFEVNLRIFRSRFILFFAFFPISFVCGFVIAQLIKFRRIGCGCSVVGEGFSSQSAFGFSV